MYKSINSRQLTPGIKFGVSFKFSIIIISTIKRDS